MGEIVNLRRARNAANGQEAAEAARQNRVRHARTASEKANDRRAEQRREALLDASRRGEARE